MAKVSVTPQAITSPIFRIRGQVSRWHYPDQRLSPENCEVLEDVNLSESGDADTRIGYAQLPSAALSGSEAVVGIVQEAFNATGVQQLYCTPTKIYADDLLTAAGRKNITGAVSLSGGADDRYRFAFLKDRIIATNNVDPLWTWAGDYTTPTNAATLTFSSPGASFSTCRDLVTHRGLLLALAPVESSVRYPTRVRWCDINSNTFVPDINKWPDTNRYEIYEGGSVIIGGVDNWGQVLIFKGDGMYPAYIEYDTGFIEMRLGQPRRGFHPISKHVIARPEFVFGVAREGCYVVRPDLSVEIITQGVQDEWRALNPNRLRDSVAWVREQEHQVHVLLSSSSNSSGNDVVLVWDWETNDISFSYYADAMNYGIRALRSGTEIDLLGSSGGKIVAGEDENTDDGTGIPWKVTMAPNDLGYPGVDKMIVNLDVYTRQREDQQEVTVTLLRDEGALPSRSFTLDFEAGAIWDLSEVWDITQTWPNIGNQKKSFYVNRLAKVIQPRFTSNSPATITGYGVTFYPTEG